MNEADAADAVRVAAVITSVVEHLTYARQLLHDLINTLPVTITAIAAEQAVEMDIRHAITDSVSLYTYLRKD